MTPRTVSCSQRPCCREQPETWDTHGEKEGSKSSRLCRRDLLSENFASKKYSSANYSLAAHFVVCFTHETSPPIYLHGGNLPSDVTRHRVEWADDIVSSSDRKGSCQSRDSRYPIGRLVRADAVSVVRGAANPLLRCHGRAFCKHHTKGFCVLVPFAPSNRIVWDLPPRFIP